MSTKKRINSNQSARNCLELLNEVQESKNVLHHLNEAVSALDDSSMS